MVRNVIKMKLKENEKIDNLEIKNLKIIQNKKWFCFGLDSVLLANFSKNIKKDANVLDLGTGTGIIPIILCGKTNLRKVIGVEIQENVAEMATRSIKLNNLQDRMEIICENILNLEKIYGKNKFDVITTNPPYKKKGEGVINEIKEKIISRHEITANLEDFIKTAGVLLKDKGEFYMVHRPERLVDIFNLMRKYKIEPKLIQMVFSNCDKPAKLVLIKGVKNSKPFLKFEKNLYIYDKNGDYTQDIKAIYEKEV